LPYTYGPRTFATLLRLIDVLCPPADIFPRPAAERVLGTVLSFVPFLPPPMRYGLPYALWLFESSPAMFGMGMRRFRSLTDEEAVRYVSKWQHGPAPFSLVYQAFRSLVLACVYQHPEILGALEIDWQTRARELLQRRAELMGKSPDVANPRNVQPRRSVG
jgi:hypothetical protein